MASCRALAALALTSSLWLAGSATAAPPTPTAFASLPVGEISSPPRPKQLHHLGGGRAEGIFVKREQREFYLVSSTKKPDPEARALAAACLSTSTGDPQSGLVNEVPTWSLQSERQIGATPQQNRGLLVVHREEVLVAGGAATLDTRDAMVDVGALAAKTIDHRVLPLGKLAELVGGVTVYGMRNAKHVEFIVLTAASSLAQPVIGAQFAGQPQLTATAQCRHIRVSAPLERGSGSAASVTLPLFEPRPDGRPPIPDASGTVSLTVRTLLVHLSVSWLASDAEPVVSASAGWQGSAQRQRHSALVVQDGVGF